MNEQPTRLYVMVADAGDTVRHFKIGISSTLLKRIAAVQTGCPMRITSVMSVPMSGRRTAQHVEAQLHTSLKPFWTSGEWFRFDMGDPLHKAAFNGACRGVLDPLLGLRWRWDFANMKKLKAAVDDGPDFAPSCRRRLVSHAFRMAKGLPMW